MGKFDDVLKNIQAATKKGDEGLKRVDAIVQADLDKKAAALKKKAAQNATPDQGQPGPAPQDDLAAIRAKLRKAELPKPVVAALTYIGVALDYDPDSVSQDIDAKRRELVRKIHPDKYTDPRIKEKTTELMKKMNEQLAILEKYGLYKR